jgi:adenylyltransferase/sulfurtransferase
MIPSPAELRSLSEDQVERFARQIIVPGIGADGQIRLCAARVFVDGHTEGCRIATQYLRAAGVTVYAAPTPPARLDCLVLASARDLSPARVQTLIEASPLVAWYTFVGRTVRGGLASAAAPVCEASLSREVAAVLRGKLPHRIAGADVATTVVAALLGWIQPGESYELELA